MDAGSAILGYLGDLAVRSLVLAAAGGAAMGLLRLKSAASRHAVWTLLTAGMLAMAMIGPLLPRVELRVLRAVPVRTVAQAMPAAAPETETRISTAITYETVARTAPVEVRHPIHWQDAAAAIYAAGLLVFLAFLASSYRFTRRLVRAAKKVDMPWAINTGAIDTYESSWITVPVTLGLVRPKILLPVGWRGWAADHLEAVMAHERTHVERADWGIAVLAGLNRCVLWFHPLSWWMEKRLSALAEEACDDAALLALGRREEYASTLLDMAAAVRSGHGRMVWEAMAMAKTAEVRNRIERILDETRQIPCGWTGTRWAAVVAFSLPLLYMTAAVQLAPAQEVRLASQEVYQLEQALLRNPEDLASRTKLIANYYLTGVRQPRLDHIYWLIEHHPESEAAIFNSNGILPRGSALNSTGDYAQAAALWRQQASRRATESAVVWNAAQFFSQPGGDLTQAERLIQQGATLEPGNGIWTQRLARLYASAILNNAGYPRYTPLTADPGFASHAQTVLESSTDVRLRSLAADALNPASLNPGESGEATLARYPQLGPVAALSERLQGKRTFSTTTTFDAARSQYVAPAQAAGRGAVVFRTGAAPTPLPQNPALNFGVVNRRVRVDPATEAEKLIRKTAAVYPDEARSAGLEGDVHLNVLIGGDGRVVSAEPIDGNPLLAAAAQEAVMKDVYQPLMMDGKGVEVATTATVPFRLDDSTPPSQAASAKPAKPGQVYTLAPLTPVTSAPLLLKRTTPDYTEEARKAKYQGTVVLHATIGVDGKVNNVLVMRSLGLGLDEKAVEAVKQWQFRPAFQNSQPVEVTATIEVNFRLLVDGQSTQPMPPQPMPTGNAPAVNFRVETSAMTVNTDSSHPVLLSRREPGYTEEARQAKLQGAVVLNVTISADGVVIGATVARSLGMGLDEQAIEAVKQWRFRPALRNGQPIQMNTTIEVNFRLL